MFQSLVKKKEMEKGRKSVLYITINCIKIVSNSIELKARNRLIPVLFSEKK